MSTPGAVRAAQSILRAEGWESHEVFMRRVEALAEHIDRCMESATPAKCCETCDNWSRDRMRCDHAPMEPCPPKCSCDNWTAIEAAPATHPDTEIVDKVSSIAGSLLHRFESVGTTQEAVCGHNAAIDFIRSVLAARKQGGAHD